jgi:CRP-like cAMP-binding protein
MQGFLDLPHMADLVGLVGVFLYLSAYFVLQLGILPGNGYAYPVLNLAAAACVLAGLQVHFNLSSMLIQVSFIAISVMGIARRFVLSRWRRFTPEELELLARKLPSLDKASARVLLRAGRWRTLPAGKRLSREGHVATQLTYVADAPVQSMRGGAILQTYAEDCLVGELSCLSDSPAVSTCILAGPARCFVIPADRLRRLAERLHRGRHGALGFLAAAQRDHDRLGRASRNTTTRTALPTVVLPTWRTRPRVSSTSTPSKDRITSPASSRPPWPDLRARR